MFDLPHLKFGFGFKRLISFLNYVCNTKPFIANNKNKIEFNSITQLCDQAAMECPRHCKLWVFESVLTYKGSPRDTYTTLDLQLNFGRFPIIRNPKFTHIRLQMVFLNACFLLNSIHCFLCILKHLKIKPRFIRNYTATSPISMNLSLLFLCTL